MERSKWFLCIYFAIELLIVKMDDLIIGKAYLNWFRNCFELSKFNRKFQWIWLIKTIKCRPGNTVFSICLFQWLCITKNSYKWTFGKARVELDIDIEYNNYMQFKYKTWRKTVERVIQAKRRKTITWKKWCNVWAALHLLISSRPFCRGHFSQSSFN